MSAIQPHIVCCTMIVIVDRPLRHTYTRNLVTFLILFYVKSPLITTCNRVLSVTGCVRSLNIFNSSQVLHSYLVGIQHFLVRILDHRYYCAPRYDCSRQCSYNICPGQNRRHGPENSILHHHHRNRKYLP